MDVRMIRWLQTSTLVKAGQFRERKTNEIFLYLEGAATMLPADS